ncbi:probably inactive leucine-rich repeat receptor-like protein kinase At5g48380 isoform X2 [Andrographis paniculata]|uniref:probably inactive leucine-rich repeat receptor-like protein kinase At5g48380 isoform X2 n=1 Tax=Andrographis paniculata TaxID=175694 RepID=UPI0021E78369|nr:probably inactive leucine-rich repeat receptor-like protein kinase At5g48380 isoform X2 [Andrographis paniculata]
MAGALPSNFRFSPSHVIILIWLVVAAPCSNADQFDIDCLQSIKRSFQDPLDSLSSWNFSNTTEGYICKFNGVECWNDGENRIINIKLSDMGLRGEFPQGISNCHSMTGLDLSRNNITGTIPNDISKLLTGRIPPEIGLLPRITTFTVTRNRLTGPVPHFVNPNATIPASSYSDNAGLCGPPLPPCRGKKARMSTIVGAAVGGFVVAALAIVIGLYYYSRKVYRKKKEEDPLGNKWATSIKDAKRIKLSMFENSISKMSLSDLMKATDDFSNVNIIGSGRTGTMYRAILGDGTSLMVKRLKDTKHSEQEFVSEMAILGNIKHRNLVPLLGFCVAKKERLLVYKYIPNGTLYEKLHVIDDDAKTMAWPLRLKVAIMAAKGFAWLHHSCNPRILHRNISSSCILLDDDYEPRISDFGLARLMNPIDTHLSTFVNGEFGDLGYVAPEYSRTLVATPKGDVYSFGVVLLELVTGEKPTFVSKALEGFKGNLAEWISKLSSDGKLNDAIDESLAGKGFDGEVYQFLKIACRCVLSAPKERPSMFEVYQLLRAVGQRYDFSTEDDLLVLPEDGGNADRVVELIVARDG